MALAKSKGTLYSTFAIVEKSQSPILLPAIAIQEKLTFLGNLKRHRVSHEAKSERQTYECEICDYVCLNINTLKDHKEAQHEDNR